MSVKNSTHLLAPFKLDVSQKNSKQKGKHWFKVFEIRDFCGIMRCFSPVMIWGQREALQAGKKLCRVCLERGSSDGCSKKVCLHTRAKSSDISSLGTQSRPLLKSQQGANSQSSTRVKTVNRGKHAVERKIPGMREIPFGGTQMYSFYFLISLTCPLQTCRYLWSEYCLDATPERLSILTRLNLCAKRIVWEEKSRYAVNKISHNPTVFKVDSNHKIMGTPLKPYSPILSYHITDPLIKWKALKAYPQNPLKWKLSLK